jgi:hypothetical protein
MCNSSADFEGASCHVVKGKFAGHGKRAHQSARNQEPQSCEHESVNSVNNLN